MASEHDDQLSGNDNAPLTTGERSQENEFGERRQGADGASAKMAGNQESESSLGGRPRQDDGDGMSGQPIGGNDSATGTGTTLTQGADFGAQNAIGEKQESGGGDTLAADRASSSDGPTKSEDDQPGQGTTSNIGGSSVGTDQTGSGSSGLAGGEGFIGSEASGSNDYLRDEQGSEDGISNSSGAAATRGSDFANQGRGALDDEQDTGENSTGSGAPT